MIWTKKDCTEIFFFRGTCELLDSHKESSFFFSNFFGNLYGLLFLILVSPKDWIESNFKPLNYWYSLPLSLLLLGKREKKDALRGIVRPSKMAIREPLLVQFLILLCMDLVWQDFCCLFICNFSCEV